MPLRPRGADVLLYFRDANSFLSGEQKKRLLRKHFSAGKVYECPWRHLQTVPKYSPSAMELRLHQLYSMSLHHAPRRATSTSNPNLLSLLSLARLSLIHLSVSARLPFPAPLLRAILLAQAVLSRLCRVSRVECD
ncbi:hypothetical protein BV898_06591 [Hypsibius exemplaris]|uniref:Uncharacterized protein n=1 Tax=Hypsibius exemplaris TaxID=2072580 RepID=A0A1W0WVY5_HYPEX|nr:hypothetical protein BV898_06591 [Hypsibius exemplaris]